MEWIYYVYLALLFLVAIAGFARYKKLNKQFRILAILILCTLISESIKKVYGKIYQNSMPVAHVWAIIEYAFYAFIFYLFLNSDRIKKVVIISIAGMLVLEIINLVFFEKITQFPSLILEVSHIIYVIYSLLLFRQMLLFPAERSLFKQSLFWFNIDVLFYATTMFLNFALLSYFIENKLDGMPLAYFSIVVNFIFYIVIGISLLIDNKKANTPGIRNG